MFDYCNTCEFIAEMDITQLTACECNTDFVSAATKKEWSYV
jgi:hypothetical protein